MKAAAKRLVIGVATVLVFPSILLYWLTCRVSSTLRVFPNWSQLYCLVPGLLGIYLRQAFFRWILNRCGRDIWIGFGTLFSHPGIKIGNAVYLGNYCSIGEVDLGDDVLVASHVSIMNGPNQHGIDRLDIPIREQPGEWKRISVGEGSWIGERAIVMADIGKGCVIGAGSVVTKPIPDYAIAVGVPARILRYRNQPPQNESAPIENKRDEVDTK